MMIALIELMLSLSGGMALSSADLCPSDDSVKILHDLRLRGDRSMNGRLAYYYSICNYNEIMIDSIEQEAFEAGDVSSGLNIVKKEFRSAIGNACAKTGDARNIIEGQRDQFGTVELEQLITIERLCTDWGGGKTKKITKKSPQ